MTASLCRRQFPRVLHDKRSRSAAIGSRTPIIPPLKKKPAVADKSSTMLFAIFTLSVIILEVILRRHPQQNARIAASAAEASTLDLLRLSEALGGVSQNAPVMEPSAVEQPLSIK
ncbi:MAG: hypothetical protein JO307_19305 [Bryobacterales bacterium]|nr:hypothetical protein [Bryobacterales bacterium]MBV9400815.1 hypothetical protein [Bryobacterales bacterium]